MGALNKAVSPIKYIHIENRTERRAAALKIRLQFRENGRQ